MTFMKQFKFCLPAGILILLLSGSLDAQSALYIRLNDVVGNHTSLNNLKGTNLTVVDFWATWCKPCVKSIPELIKLSEQYKPKGVEFIGVNEDSPRNTSKVRPFVNSMGISYPVLLDSEQKIMKTYLISVLPTLIIVDSSGEILYTHEGYTSGDEKIIQTKIDELLANRK